MKTPTPMNPYSLRCNRLFPLLLCFAVSFMATADFAFAQSSKGLSEKSSDRNTSSRWEIQADGSIIWRVRDTDEPHFDHIEMSGEKMSAVIRYGVDCSGGFSMERSLVFPMLRTIPNNTHASLMRRFAVDIPSLLIVNGRTLKNERAELLQLNGKLSVVSLFDAGYGLVGGARATVTPPVVRVTRTVFPSTTLPVFCEKYVIENISAKSLTINVPEYLSEYLTDSEEGVRGSYKLVSAIIGSGLYKLAQGDSLQFYAYFSAMLPDEDIVLDVAVEEEKRDDFVSEIWEKLVLDTPDTVLNTAFAFAKVRASESIFRTKGGLMHAPGGESYYAAIWANDQAEYVNPFFPFIGYDRGNESAINSFRHFARFMNDKYKSLPSSIIAEGDDIWNGAGDRGDAAMIAYGASRFALEYGDIAAAEELWSLIEWCLEYSRRHLTVDGVVASDTDELEGRFPSGKANLCTSSLYYDALVSASYLANELGENVKARSYKKRAAQLCKDIESYFGVEVEGFETYRYYDGNDVLRSWICIPLTVGIYDRKEGTVAALLSPRLLTENGLLTQAGSETFWDRTTLYALRGLFASGAVEEAVNFLKNYSDTRLLGEHVPYPIEAWPEGNQRHLAAESGLYCRVYTEGLFGIRPTGFHSFMVAPQLPAEWGSMALRNIRAFGEGSFDIEVKRLQGRKIAVAIIIKGKPIQYFTIAEGKSVEISL